MKQILPKAVWCALVGLVFAPGLRAVEVGSSYQTTAPTNSDSTAYQAWNYVGSNGDSAVYLGDYNGTYWVLTASHVGAGDFTLNGVTYTVVSDSTYNDFTTTINGTSETADLTLYQITGSADALASLPTTNLTLAGQTGGSEPTQNSTVLMIGYGGSMGETWGKNTVYGVSAFSDAGYPYASVGIVTLASGESGNGGQGVGGDSGGGMFQEQGFGTNKKLVLVGILAGVGDVSVTSGNTTTDEGNGTFAVDLVYYSSQIMADINAAAASAIPEPASMALGFGAAVLGLALWRRRHAG